MRIVMLIGFIFDTMCVVGGGFAIPRGETYPGKLSIIGGLIIAGAPIIVRTGAERRLSRAGCRAPLPSSFRRRD